MLTNEQIEVKAAEIRKERMGDLKAAIFRNAATWANEQNGKQFIAEMLELRMDYAKAKDEIAELKFRAEGDAILLQAANQTIEKERAKVAGYQSEQTGLRQTISDQFGRIMDLEGEKAELLAALQELYDEQNDAPLETRRHEWNRAMARAGELLKKYGNG